MSRWITWRLSPNSPDTTPKTNPPPPPPPPADEAAASPPPAAAEQQPSPPFKFYDPQLTRGQAQVLRAEQPRLFRMLDVRDHRRLAKLAAVLELLEDLAEQAPAVDDALAVEDERRRAADADRPRLAGLLSKRGQS